MRSTGLVAMVWLCVLTTAPVMAEPSGWGESSPGMGAAWVLDTPGASVQRGPEIEPSG